MKISTVRLIAFFAVAALVLVLVGRAPNSEAQGRPTFSLPPQAAEVAPGVFFLGNSVENGVPIVGYAYAHHRQGHNGGPGGGDPPPEEDPPPEDAASCFSFIANGAYWRQAEDVIVDSRSSLGVSVSDISGWMGAWEAPVGPIYGSFRPATEQLEADTTSTDGKNEVYFANIPEEDVLGYAIVWYVRRGPPSSRGIVEADIVVEDVDEVVDLNWWIPRPETTIGENQLDLGDVFTHEAGHYVGLGHAEETVLCEKQMMYPSLFAGVDGDLEAGDIAGIKALYN